MIFDKKNIAAILLYFVFLSPDVGASEASTLTEVQKYQKCYLVSYYVQQALLMRYSGLSRFEIMDIFKDLVSKKAPDGMEEMNRDTLVDYEKYIDVAFEAGMFTDEKDAETKINKNKDGSYEKCMNN